MSDAEVFEFTSFGREHGHVGECLRIPFLGQVAPIHLQDARMDRSDGGPPSIWLSRILCGVRTPRDRMTCASGKLLESAPGRWPQSQVINSLSVFPGRVPGDGNEYTVLSPRIPRTGQKAVANGVVHCSGRSGPGQLLSTYRAAQPFGLMQILGTQDLGRWDSPSVDVDVCGNPALIEATIRGMSYVLRSRNTKTREYKRVAGQVH
ncbi:hypothetical protein EDB86DRAFT_2825661 [Lactarius hatsudake]|nr:hypothetical protein EDB86DRAFT_2825661 [Lactarius hatsudake]